MPRTGGLLLVANHQSYLDPILVGVCMRRPLSFMARRTLFRSRLFGTLIRWCRSFPVERGRADLRGIKETIRRLARGEAVLIFPEGTRSRTGRIGTIKPGFAMLAQRARVPVLPVRIDGAWRVWPRDRRLPRPGRVQVTFGRPIAAEAVAQMSNEDLARQVEQQLSGLE